MKKATDCLGALYNIKKDFEYDTIKYSIHSLIQQYERNPNPFYMENLENWYNVNIWGPIVDKCYNDIDYINVVRTCYGKSSITLEYGGSEVEKNYEGKKSTKWLSEADLKLPKVLKDMLLLLNSHVSDMSERRELITVGYIHGGLQLMFMTLDSPVL
ncbi:13503_t:CDS:2 [Entrophospora sp. SA101]|nr:13503_t:CDS:2 [Entrophospora sp. SA101]CAJ0877391.1 1182_t:CDS:2 [Entrophospora sp. SA101]